ncbi:MAG: hypothetical protein LBD20_09040, partial [Spirochaetaceae bacterium]|nr:hypothetical protein [Spirochaetaceae bacterium]
NPKPEGSPRIRTLYRRLSRLNAPYLAGRRLAGNGAFRRSIAIARNGAIAAHELISVASM